MPTLQERVATVEVVASTTSVDVKEIKQDVKTLLAWYSEERGARHQRTITLKQMGVFFSVVTLVINVVFKVVVP